jgi:hypothetical protein
MVYDKEEANKIFADFIRKYLFKDPDACLWILGFNVYVHSIDDFIDGAEKDPIHMLRIQELALAVYCNDWFRRHQHILYPLIRAASNCYMDSVILETKTDFWKKQVADALRQFANEIIIATIEIVSGYEARREASMEVREISWKAHHEKDGTPV